MAESAASVVAETQRYYDSEDADAFYERVWGGEDIHIGLYDAPDDSVAAASRKTVQTMAERLGAGIGRDARVLDLGAGYGGSARVLAGRFGCHVTCLNLSERQNRRNVQLCEEAGLSDRVDVRQGDFEKLPFEGASFDVAWSQDSFLHSARREAVMAEATRVLDRGGQLIFTDPMQADDCPPGVLSDVYERIHLDSMGSFAFYRRIARELGLEEVAVVDLSRQLRIHYARVRAELMRQRATLRDQISAAYIDQMINGLESWVDAADRGWLAWGILHFRRP